MAAGCWSRRVVDEGWTLAAAAEAAGVSVRTARSGSRRYRVEGERAVGSLLGAASVPDRTDERTVAGDRGAAPVADDRGRDRRDARDAALDRLGGPDADRDGQARPARARARRSATSATVRASWSTSTSRSSAASHGGAGHRVTGSRHYNASSPTARQAPRRIGWEYVHVAVDDATRLAYVEVLADEKAITAIGFLRRAVALLRRHGITRRAADHRRMKVKWRWMRLVGSFRWVRVTDGAKRRPRGL